MIETYEEQMSFYSDRRYLSEIQFEEPEALYDAVVYMNVFLFNIGIPYEMQNWSCRPLSDRPGYVISVLYTLTVDDILRSKL